MPLRRFSVPVLALLGIVAMGGLTPATAQEATPLAGTGVACDVEPRSADELLALWYGDADTSDATPVSGGEGRTEAEPSTAAEVTIPLGEPADAETVAAVTQTIDLVFACFASGDVLRAYALFTDDLATLFGPEPGTPREEAEAFLAGDLGEDDEGEESQVIAVASVMMLGDGRVSTFVVDRYAAGDAVTYVVFEEVDGRWLADEVVEFPIPGEEDGG